MLQSDTILDLHTNPVVDFLPDRRHCSPIASIANYSEKGRSLHEHTNKYHYSGGGIKAADADTKVHV